MKILYLLRHAKAEEQKAGGKDFDRELVKKGIQDSHLIGNKLKERQVLPGLVISSPAPRALKTAIIVAADIGYPPEEILQEKRLYHSECEDFMEFLAEWDDNVGSMMLVGHNPGISDFANYLCGDITESLSKGAVAAISFEARKWKDVEKLTGKKVFTETPKNLRR
jgi:phosphohistidine phosphatase